MTKAACLGLLVVHGIREWAGQRGGVGVGQGLQQSHISAHPSLLMSIVPHLHISLLVWYQEQVAQNKSSTLQKNGNRFQKPVLAIRICMFLGLLDLDLLVRGMDPDPSLFS
jgi:hypothetical protein